MDWHARYTQQAGWTAQLRAFLFKQAGLHGAQRLLEIGCGTGAVLADFASQPGLYGLDLDLDVLPQAHLHAPTALLTCADALHLPYASAVFDAVFCHFTLLWLNDPFRALVEMRRVTCPGGALLALAEPDYGGRVDYPLELAELGRWQGAALKQQGADPQMGRKLAAAFARAGVQHVQTGVIGAQWQSAPSAREIELEWQTLASDLKEHAGAAQLQEMRNLDERAWALGERVLYVPTFYAWGVV
jgi:SAM-dependent methyltransferase